MSGGKAIILAIISLVILGLEQTYGPPFLFLTLVILLSHQSESKVRLLIWLASGISLAVMYHLSLSWGVVVILGVMASFELSQRVIKTVGGRIVVSSSLGTLFMAVLTKMAITPGFLLSTTMSVVISIVLLRYIFLIRNKKSLNI